MDVAEPATGVVADAGTVAPDRAQMKTVYVLALVSFVILPLIAYSFSGPRWGFFASFLLGGGALLTALVLMVVMFMTIPGASRRRRVIAAVAAVFFRFGIMFLPLYFDAGYFGPAIQIAGVVAAWFFARRVSAVAYLAVVVAPLVYLGLEYPIDAFLRSLDLYYYSRKTTIIYAIPAALIPAIAMASAVLVGTLFARVRASRKLSPIDPTEEAHE